MFEELQFIDNIVKEFIIYIILGLAAIVGGLIRRKYNSNSNKLGDFITDNKKRLDKMQGCLDNQNARGIRQSENQIDMAEHTDNETARLHGADEPKNPIKARIERNLKDEFGNL